MSDLFSEAARYLGLPPDRCDEDSEREIKTHLDWLRQHIPGRTAHRILPLSLTPDSVCVGGETFVSRNLSRHLRGCTRAVLFAATLGAETDRRLKTLSVTGVFSAVVFDACASAYIEQVCDDACDALAETLSPEGLSLTSRFSPGYGDLDLENQEMFLRLLPAGRRIGLTLTPSMLLIPTKSVTAFIGAGPAAAQTESKSLGCSGLNCENCPRRDSCQIYAARKSDQV